MRRRTSFLIDKLRKCQHIHSLTLWKRKIPFHIRYVLIAPVGRIDNPLLHKTESDERIRINILRVIANSHRKHCNRVCRGLLVARIDDRPIVPLIERDSRIFKSAICKTGCFKSPRSRYALHETTSRLNDFCFSDLIILENFNKEV